MLDLYDDTNPSSIEEYGKKLIGKTFRYISEHPVNPSILMVKEDGVNYGDSHAKKGYKGGMGNLVEECYFGYKANNDEKPDFDKAGVELKVTPYKAIKKGFSAKERLVLTMIDYFAVAEEKDFENSHVWQKCKLMLLVWYLWEKGKSNLDLFVNYVSLFTPPAEDLDIIKADYKKIQDKIKAGKAHELSEGDTLYLGACTKGATAQDTRMQPFSDKPARQRAFSLKNSYMTYILKNYIIPNIITHKTNSLNKQCCHEEYKIIEEESIIKNTGITDFEKCVKDKILNYVGKTDLELCDYFDVNRESKQWGATVVYRILGIRGNHAAEFEKANIKIKTIRINKRGGICENMSFPAFKYTDLAEETWDTSTFANMLRENRYLFVIYNEIERNEFVLADCMFWNMPNSDIERYVKPVWKKMHDIVAEGRILVTRIGDKFFNNFPKQSENPVTHVRPHAQNIKDVYPLPIGTKIQYNGADSLPWGNLTHYPKHCFWLNNSYLIEQIKNGMV